MQCYSYPWQKYVKLGSVLRHFAYTVAALHGCLESEIQVLQKLQTYHAFPDLLSGISILFQAKPSFYITCAHIVIFIDVEDSDIRQITISNPMH